MKNFSLILSLSAMICFLCACSNHTQLNEKDFPLFSTLFVNEFPVEVYDRNSDCDVYVNKSQSVFGDYNYVVAVTIRFDAEDSFINRKKELCQSAVSVLGSENKTVCLYQWSEDEYLEYTNGEKWDGYSFNYEIVFVNNDARTVEYLFAHVWDYWTDAHLLEDLQQVYALIEE